MDCSMMLIACKSSFDIVRCVVATFLVTEACKLLVEFVVTPDGVYGQEVPPFPSNGPRMVCTSSFLNSQQRVSQWLPFHRWHLDVVFPESTSLDEGFLPSLTPFFSPKVPKVPAFRPRVLLSLPLVFKSLLMFTKTGWFNTLAFNSQTLQCL